MNAETKKRLTEGGIDVDGALERMLGSETLLLSLLKKFAKDKNYERWLISMDAGDLQEATEAAHALKGISGNLSITELYRLFSKQVEELRAERWEEAQAMRPQIMEAYERATGAIRELET
mgnify:CR=1 FL=1